ncbi:MAG: recombinase family protein [Deltaproteobacteria bacterium]|nr:recombinase family protein [Deltaproteobacteria bacterium]
MGHRDLLKVGRVAIYARFSSDKQSETSVADQVERCREYVDRHGGNGVAAVVFQDEAISGASLQRPGWEALMAAVRSTAIDVIVTEDMSRVTREFADWGQVFRELQFLNVPLVSVQQGTSTADKGAKLGLHFKALIAEQYLDDLRDKTHRGMKGQAKRGKPTGLLPYGFVNDKTLDERGEVIDQEVVIDAERAAVVVRIFQLKAQGLTYGRIAALLNEDGVTPPRGNGSRRRPGWVASGIRAILKNEKYIGVWRWNVRRFVKVPGTNKRVARMRPQSEHVVETYEERRIVPQDLWDQVQEQFRRNDKVYGAKPGDRRGRPSQYLLSGLLFCGACGSVLTVHGGSKGRRYYRCDARAKRGTCDVKISIRESLVRERVLAGIADTLRCPEVVQLVRKRLVAERARRAKGDTVEVRDRKARLETIEAEMANLVRFIAKGVGSDAVSAELERLEKQAKAERAAIASLEAQIPAAVRLPTLSEAMRRVTDLQSLLDGDVEPAREALRRLLRDGRIHVHLENGDYIARGVVFPMAVFLGTDGKHNAAPGGPRAAWYKSGCGGQI